MNRNTFLKRRQATFGMSYTFGKQRSHAIGGPVQEWPELVQRVYQYACEQGASKPLAVHVNWYPDGSAGVQPHADV